MSLFSPRYMGVTAGVGMPGSGKTYWLAQVAAAAMREGRPVYANADEHGQPWIRGARPFSSFEEFLQIPSGTTVVWDELPIYVNSRKWQEFPDGLLYRLSQIRKDALHLYYSAIDEDMVDLTVRRLTFWVWECHSITSRLLVRRRFPPKARRKKDERCRERKLVRVRPEVAELYNTLGKVAAPVKVVEAYSKTSGEQWVSPVGSLPAGDQPRDEAGVGPARSAGDSLIVRPQLERGVAARAATGGAPTVSPRAATERARKVESLEERLLRRAEGG